MVKWFRNIVREWDNLKVKILIDSPSRWAPIMSCEFTYDKKLPCNDSRTISLARGGQHEC